MYNVFCRIFILGLPNISNIFGGNKKHENYKFIEIHIRTSPSCPSVVDGWSAGWLVSRLLNTLVSMPG